MKYLLNRYKFLLILYLPIFIFVCVICFTKTNKSVTTTGDINDISKFMVVENGYKSEGSLNSVFVYGIDHTSIFQNWCVSLDKNGEVETMAKNYSQFSTDELNLMGRIQKNQSIEASAICAYEAAHKLDSQISIEYDYVGLIVRYLIISNDMQFKIGDIITSINGIKPADKEAFNLEYSKMFEGSVVEILRKNSYLTLTLNSSSAHIKNGDNTEAHIGIYEKFNIKKTTPELTLRSQNTQGPSAGLMQTLSIYNMLVSEDITGGMTVCGTGTIDTRNNVGAIGGIKEKIVAAYKNNVRVFLCPSANIDDARSQYAHLGRKKSRMKLYEVNTFEDALEVLNEACK